MGLSQHTTVVMHVTRWYTVRMNKTQRKQPTEPKTVIGAKKEKEPREKTPTFLLELPLWTDEGQAKRIRGHLEAGRQLYNAILSEGNRRLKQMRASQAWQEARAIPRSQNAQRRAAFTALRTQYGFSDYALQAVAITLRVDWIADHLDAPLAQKLGTRAYQALNRVCLGTARRVRFKSKGRGLSSLENKRNDTGLRFVLQQPEEGKRGFLRWKDDLIEARLDWDDPVVAHALRHRVKYARIIQRKASSPQAEGADSHGFRYCVQLALEGVPHHKPKHPVGTSTVGLDLGPSTVAIVPREGQASLAVFCEPLDDAAKPIRRLQRKMDRQRRAANPDNYDEKGRIKRGAPLHWKSSTSYQKTRARKATTERKVAAHRKSLHGKMAHAIVALGTTIQMEKISYKAWQKTFGKSIGKRAPGMFVAHLRRTVASTGGTLLEFSTQKTKFSQFCHGCGTCKKKALRQRVHVCSCGIGPVQRDLYSAFLAAFLEPNMLSRPRGPGHAESGGPGGRYWKHAWDGVETRLQAAHDVVKQRAKDGQSLPRSMSVPRARARQPERLSEALLEPPLVFRHNRVEAETHRTEPTGL
jgi:transposase